MWKFRNIIGSLLVVLYLCHHASYNYSYHVHHFSWGKVSHSHPYFPGNGSAGHSHTAAQCNLISQITSQGYTGAENTTIPVLYGFLLLTLCVYIITPKTELFSISLPGRSPPSC